MMNEQSNDSMKKSSMKLSFLLKQKRCKEQDIGESRGNHAHTYPKDRDKFVDRRLALSTADRPVFSSERIIGKSPKNYAKGSFFLEVENQRGIRSKSCPDVFVDTSFEVSQFKREMRKIYWAKIWGLWTFNLKKEKKEKKKERKEK
mmetsp:Transcript_1876/g.2691  ORF Transcript_1876/g.2691 Transcript_1876/m.2691 type:complete len:146 (-) Transcript_1876:2-439(-)